MSLVKELASVAYRQTRNFRRLIKRQQVVFPSLSSMTLDSDDVELVRRWLNRKPDWYRAKEIKQYHEAFARWNDSLTAFSFMGARVALSAAIYTLGLEPGDEVILPGYTCIVVPNAFHFAGIETVYSDIELDTYGLDAAEVEEKITSRTRAILLHHLYGLVCRDYEAIIEIARKHNLFIIEDCAQSTGAEFRGKKVGNWGDVAIYSSEQSKIFNTIQGGLVTTNDEQLSHKLREYYDKAPFPGEQRVDKLLHNVIVNYYRFKHPQRWWLGDATLLRYYSKRMVPTTKEEVQGVRPTHYGQKLPAPLAIIGLNQLRKVDYYNQKRRENARIWDRWCERNNYAKPLLVEGSVPVYLRYPLMVESDKKQQPVWAMNELGVELGVWFKSQLHPADRSVRGCPNAMRAVECCVNLPTLDLDLSMAKH